MPTPEQSNSSEVKKPNLQSELEESKRLKAAIKLEGEKHGRNTEILQQDDKEIQQARKKDEALSRIENTKSSELLALSLQTNRPDLVEKAMTEVITPAIKKLITLKKDNPQLQELYDLYKKFVDVYEKNLGPNRNFPTDKKRTEALASAIVGMQYVAREMNQYVETQKQPNRSSARLYRNDDVWAKAKRHLQFGTSEDQLRQTITSLPAFQAKEKELAARANALFGTPAKPGPYALIINATAHFPDDPRLAAIKAFCKPLADKDYRQSTNENYKKEKEEKGFAEPFKNDPALLAKAEDAIAWMELASKEFLSYANTNTEVLAYVKNPNTYKSPVQIRPEILVADKPKTETTEATTTVPKNSVKPVPVKPVTPEATPSTTVQKEPGQPKTVEPVPEKVEPTKPEPEVVAVKLTPSQLEAARWIVENGKSIMGDDGLTDDDLGMDPDPAKNRNTDGKMLSLFIDHANTLGEIGANLKQGEEISSLQRIIEMQRSSGEKKIPSKASGKAKSSSSPSLLNSVGNFFSTEKKEKTEQKNTVNEAGTSSAEEKVEAPVVLSDEEVKKQFDNPVALAQLSTRINTLFRQYEKGVGSAEDHRDHGADLKWQASRGESRQLIAEYRASRDGTQFPKAMTKRRQMLSVLDQLDALLTKYDATKWPDKPLKKEEPLWMPEKKTETWQNRSHRLAKEHQALLDTYHKPEHPQYKTCQQFQATLTPYWNLYKKFKNTNDVPMINATFDQIERATHFYKERMEGKTPARPVPIPLGISNPLVLISLVGAEDKAAVYLPERFKSATSRLEVREGVIDSIQMKPFRELNEQEIEALLYLKVHFSDIAGKDGELNDGDVGNLAELLKNDALSRPAELYQTILKKRGFAPNSYEAGGLRKALGLEGVMTAEQASQYNTGISMEQGFFGRILLGLSGKYDELQNAKAQLWQLEGVKAQIPVEVKQEAQSQLTANLREARVVPTTKRDNGPYRVTQSVMEKIRASLNVVNTMSGASLAVLLPYTKAEKIETYAPDGPSIRSVDWMLEANILPDGKIGTPPGVNFWIEMKDKALPIRSTPKQEKIAVAPLVKNEATPKQGEKKDDGFEVVKSRAPSESVASEKSPTDKSVFAKGIPSTLIQPPESVADVNPVAPKQSSVEPLKAIPVMRTIDVYKVAREIHVPRGESFTIACDPSPGIATVNFKSETNLPYFNAALEVTPWRDSWVVKVKPSYEGVVTVSRDADHSQTLLPVKRIENVAVPQRSQEVVKTNEVFDPSEVGIHPITSAKQLETILKAAKKPVLIKFEATWCGPCQAMSKIIQKMSKDYLILAVDVDKNQDIAQKYKVETIPHFIAPTPDGRSFNVVNGLTTEEALRVIINKSNGPSSTLSSATPPQPK